MHPGAHGKVNAIAELEYTTWTVEEEFGQYQWPGWELRLSNDGLVFMATRTADPAECKRMAERLQLEVRLFGWNVGVDIRRPGTWRRYNGPKPHEPWDPMKDYDELLSTLWGVRDDAMRLARLLEKAPKDLNRQEAINSA